VDVPATKVSKEVPQCGHGDSHPSERLVYDKATLGTKNAIVWLADISKGGQNCRKVSPLERGRAGVHRGVGQHLSGAQPASRVQPDWRHAGEGMTRGHLPPGIVQGDPRLARHRKPAGRVSRAGDLET
jgi:hypothetical protein